jgi:hypothetical protein
MLGFLVAFILLPLCGERLRGAARVETGHEPPGPAAAR